jgi:hypothetical protein
MTPEQPDKKSAEPAESPKPSLKEAADRASQIMIDNLNRARLESPDTAPRS